MSTRTVTVQIKNQSTWDDIVGPDPKNPRYVLCCGTILVVGGDLQSNTVDNRPDENVLDEVNHKISFNWNVSDKHIQYKADFVPRTDNLVFPEEPTKNATVMDPKDKDVYLIHRDAKEPHEMTTKLVKDTDSWAKDIKKVPEFIGIENNFTVQPILWKIVEGTKDKDGKTTTEPEITRAYPGQGVKSDYWVHGKGTIELFPRNIINIWFQRQAKSNSFSTVDQSDKGIVNVYQNGPDRNPETLVYDEDDGWPEVKVEEIITTNAAGAGKHEAEPKKPGVDGQPETGDKEPTKKPDVDGQPETGDKEPIKKADEEVVGSKHEVDAATS